MKFPAALEILRERVKPMREKNKDKGFRDKWWLFGRPRVEWRRASVELSHYIVGIRHGKRLFVVWSDAWAMGSDATNVFAFDDDYSMGMLSSYAHGAWAWSRSSTLKGDIRYTPSTVFETFPWPDPVSDEQREGIAEASRRVIARRQEICLENQFGLTKLYNLVDDGAYADLKALHLDLDEAVVAAYGWPRSIAQDADALVQRLLQLNREISAGDRPYDPFGTAPKAVAETLDLEE